MSWTFDAALDVPPVDELDGWFFSAASPPVHPPIDASQYPRRFDLLELVSVNSFWDELGRGSLTRAVASLCAGLARINARLLVSFQRQGETLSMVIGIGVADFGGTGMLFDLAVPLLQGALPSAQLRPLPTHATTLVDRLFRPGHAVALAGAPRTPMSPPERPLIEVLDSTRADRWSLTIEAEPVDSATINRRLIELDQRIQTLADEAGTTVRVSPTASRTARNVESENLIALLGRERDRTLSALRRGGFVLTTWLTADAGATVVALAGAATSVLAPSVVEPRGLVVLPSQRGGHAPGSFVSADELATYIHPPLHDLPGLRVAEWSRFDQNPEIEGRPAGPVIQIGHTDRGVGLGYPRDRLTAHALVTGITGSGKSSFIGSLLHELSGGGPSAVPFMVIEPTKDEYRSYVDASCVWAVGAPTGTRFRLNPFEVPNGTPVQTHVDVLIALFTSSFSLISPLPFVLEIAIRQAYEARGWDFGTNTNDHAHLSGHPLFPSFSEVLATAENVIEELGYQGEVRHNVRGALRARLGAMTEGAKGLSFDTDRPFDLDRILRTPFVVNLDLVGSDEEKAFIIGLILVRLWEARRGIRSRTLEHVVVLEEAHRILRRDAPGGAVGDQRGGAAFASELFANLLAEVRAAGQAVIVVDQSPRKLSTDALANTALKIAFRSTYAGDKAELASALNLDETQQRSLTGLHTHEAAVFWEGMDRPVLATMASHFPPPPSASPPTAAVARAPSSRSRVRTSSSSTVASPATGATAATASSVVIREIVGVLLRADGEERSVVLREAVRVTATAGRAAIGAAAALEIERLGVARRWSPEIRDALIAGFDSGREDVRTRLLDGTGEMRACAAICPSTGCLMRERVRELKALRRSDGVVARDWVSMPTPVLVATLGRELGALGRDDLAPRVASVARKCLVAHVLEDRVPDADLDNVLERLG